MIFDKERFVYLNNVRLGNNGFKNLSFETSRFSDSFSSIRGFGSHLNEKNLSIVDAFSLEFYIDYKELASFAEVYIMFKTLGVLKLENKYIIDKIASSLSHQRAVKEVLLSYKDDLKAKEITSLLVLLERMDITSLDRTDKGFSVNMVLTILKDGFTENQSLLYNHKLKDWKEETDFHGTIDKPISSYISELKTDGGVLVEIFDTEMVNAKQKEKVLLNFKSNYIKEESDKDSLEKDATERLDTLNQFEDYKPESIKIPVTNIAQIQLMTNNTISNLPIVGEPVGEKAFMGIDKTGFTIKLIFDESDKKLVEQLKSLSDLNISKHKIKITNALVNLFDFKSGIITNIFFNNTESANGIMITIKFELSAYDYFNDNANTDTIVDFAGKAYYSSDAYMTNLYLESLCSEVLGFNNENSKRKELTKLFSLPLFREMVDSKDRVGDIGLDTVSDIKFLPTYAFGDLLNAYTSEITGFGGISESTTQIGATESDTGNRVLIPTPVKKFNEYINGLHSKSFFYTLADGLVTGNGTMSDTDIINMGRKDFSNGYFYRFLDMTASSLLLKSEESIKNIKKEFSGETVGAVGGTGDLYDFLFSNKDGLFSQKLVERIVGEMFNSKVQALDDRITIYMKIAYRTFFYDLFEVTSKTKLLKDLKSKTTFVTTRGIEFNEIRELIANGVKEYVSVFLKTINSKTFKNDATTMMLSELVDGKNLKTEGYTRENLSKFIEKMTTEITDQITYSYSSIEKEIDKSMGYFLTKLLFSSSMTHIEKSHFDGKLNEALEQMFKKDNTEIPVDSVIKSHIISSAIMGFLSVKTKYRTDSFGYAYDSSAKLISKTISSFFYLHKKKFLKQMEGELFEKTDSEVVNEFFGTKVEKSYYKEKVMLGLVDVERNIINEQNKDYNYIYGKKIKNNGIVMFLNNVVNEASGLRRLNLDIDAYLLTKFTQFESGEKFCETVDDIEFNYPANQQQKPLSFDKNNISANGKITNLMKKRLIGTSDVFNDLKKLNRVVNNPVFDVMPDYEVVIKKRDLDYEGMVGSRNNFSISSAFILKNILKINVGLDPKTKIKTATITSVDPGKRIVDLTHDGSISVQVTTKKSVSLLTGESGEVDYSVEQKDVVELFTIEAGDLIEIRLGCFDSPSGDSTEADEDFKKSIVFRGTISKISNMSNITELACVSHASSLYSVKHKKVLFGSPNLLSKAINFVTTQVRKFYTNSTMITSSSVNSNKDTKTANNHLFKGFGDKGNFNTIGEKTELASFYNAAHFALGSLSSATSGLITGSNVQNSGLAMRKFIHGELSVPFGTLSEIEDPRSSVVDSNIFRNIYNVDKDYDTYGVTQITPDKENDNVTEEYITSTSTAPKMDKRFIADEDIEEEPEVTEESKVVVIEDFIWPTKSKLVTSPFALKRKHPVSGKILPHRGIDIGMLRGSDGNKLNTINYIYASRDGICRNSRSSGGGIAVTIDHSYYKDSKKITCNTFYCHLERSEVFEGQKVKAGDIIGVMGATGKVKGVHLHFEIRMNGEKLNPETFLRR
ncbi:MAG: M23 family metallopeptidase [Paraclostridium sp.]